MDTYIGNIDLDQIISTPFLYYYVNGYKQILSTKIDDKIVSWFSKKYNDDIVNTYVIFYKNGDQVRIPFEEYKKQLSLKSS